MNNLKVRSQRKTLLMLLISVILLAFLIDLLASLVFEQVRLYSWQQLLVLVVSAIVITVLITPIILTEPYPTIIKQFNIPIVFKLKRNRIKIIDVEDYFVSLAAKIDVEDIFQNNPILKKRFLDSFKTRQSEEESELERAFEEWNFFFVRNLAQYLIWSKYQTAIATDYFDRLETYRGLKIPSTEISFGDYPKGLANNLFISTFTSTERKPEGDISDTVMASTEYGEWMNPAFLSLRFPHGMKLIAEDSEKINPSLLFKGIHGELRIEYSVSSLTIEGQKISMFTSEELDFHPDREKYNPSWNIRIVISLKLSRFASFRKGLPDFLDWSETVISELEEMDWSLFLKRIPHYRIRKLENKLDKVIDELRHLKK